MMELVEDIPISAQDFYEAGVRAARKP